MKSSTTAASPASRVNQHNSNSQAQAPWRIGVDVGGTFTDMVLRDSTGQSFVIKVPSVPDDPSQGVMNALAEAAAQMSLSLRELLSQCSLFVHGSTVATNTILEGKGAKIGMLTTRGFRDSLEIRRGIRENQWDHRSPFPPVLAPRYLRLPVSGRIDRDGMETEVLDLEDITNAAVLFQREGVEAVAITFLNSYLNLAHEKAALAALEAAVPDLWLSASSEIAPIMGEYERSSTAAMNAYVAPRVVGYLQALDAALRENGLPHTLLMLQSNGGAVSVSQVAKRPVNLVLSGPAAGVGALGLAAQQIGDDNLIAMEIGGTSCDVMLMYQGEVPVSEELHINGYHLGTPSIDIHTVGAGGGTIAWIDSAGMLRVGPEGAGAQPGPACYGQGGTAPTATDAQMALGRMRPGPYAGGSVTLDLALAENAIDQNLAKPLGITVEAAAVGVIQLLEQNLLHAVERISIERGHDPANFMLVAAGGAGPMHGISVARALGCRRVYVPRQAGAFCAIGMLNSDVRQDFLRVFIGDLDETPTTDIEGILGGLRSEAESFLAMEGFAPENRHLLAELDLRYRGQLWSIRVALTDGKIDAVTIRADFESQHDRQFGHIQPGGRIDVTALRIVAYGRIERLAAGENPLQQQSIEPHHRQSVYLGEDIGRQDTPVYNGVDLPPGWQATGPLLIEEATMTALVGPGDHVIVDGADNFLITLGGDDDEQR